MSSVVVDTHTVIWHLTEPQHLSATASVAVDAAEANGAIYVSAVTLIELVYLIEKGRIAADFLKLLRASLDDPTTAFQLIDVNRAIADTLASIPRALVPDMPDRIIAATALHLNLPLVTRDRRMQTANIKTIW